MSNVVMVWGKNKGFWYFTLILLALFLVLNVFKCLLRKQKGETGPAGMQGPGIGFSFALQDFLGSWEWRSLPALPCRRERGWRGELAAQPKSGGSSSQQSRGKVNRCESLVLSRVPAQRHLASLALGEGTGSPAGLPGTPCGPSWLVPGRPLPFHHRLAVPLMEA